MAYNKGCVVGEVTEIEIGEKFDVVMVLDRSKPQYPSEVACEFMGKSRELIRGLRVGEWVSVEGSLRSKRSQKTGHKFTNFVCYSVGHLEFGQGAAPAPQQHREVKAPPPPAVDGDDLLF